MILGNRYRVLRPIKSGGMGAVYLAEDQHLAGGLCAVKAILEAVKDDPIILRKFQNESALLSQLRHPGIPRVRDYFVEAETAYIVMDYVAGENLELLDGEPRPLAEVREVALAVLDILIYLHGLPTPVIHCDIKPANLIREAGSGKIKLVDFGLARALENRQTQTVAGTLGFSAMEQLQGHAEPRSDLYSLGVSLYYLLTGQVPTFLMVPSVLESRPDTPPELAWVVDSATRLELERRPQSASAMRQALLEGAPAAPVAPAPPLPPPVSWRSTIRESCATLLRPSPALTMCLLQLLMCLLLYLLLDRTQAKEWLWLGIAGQLMLVFGYAGSVFLERLQSGRPALPAWGNGLLHLRRGLLSLAWLALLLGPLWLLGVLPFQWALGALLSNTGVSAPWAFLATLWGLVSLLWITALALCGPWSWARLQSSSSLGQSLLGLRDLRRQIEPLQLLKAAGWFWGWGLLAWLLLMTPLWLLAPVPALLAWLVGADLVAVLFKPSSPQLAARPAPEGSAPVALGICLAWLALIVYQACYLPSRDTQRLPFCDVRGVGLVNARGWVSLPPRWQAIEPFTTGESATPARQSGLWGYLRRDGSWQVPPRFQRAYPFPKDGPARVRDRDQYFYVNQQGEPISSERYLEARDFHEGLAAARCERGWGFLDRKGLWVLPPVYGSEPGRFSQGWIRVELHKPESQLLAPPVIFVNSQGQRLNQMSFAQAGEFAEGVAPVQVDGGWAFLDLHGKIGASRYDDLHSYSEGRAAFRQGQDWGFLDIRGNPVIAPMFTSVRDFHEGMAAVQRANKWGFVNLQGEIWLEPEFVQVGDWLEGVTLFRASQALGYVDRSKRRFWMRSVRNADHLDSAWRLLQIPE